MQKNAKAYTKFPLNYQWNTKLMENLIVLFNVRRKIVFFLKL